jgi:uncharacterized membrane protein YadS
LAVLGMLTRVMVLGFLAVMLAAWAINAAHADKEPKKTDRPVTRMYS